MAITGLTLSLLWLMAWTVPSSNRKTSSQLGTPTRAMGQGCTGRLLLASSMASSAGLKAPSQPGHGQTRWFSVINLSMSWMTTRWFMRIKAIGTTKEIHQGSSHLLQRQTMLYKRVTRRWEPGTSPSTGALSASELSPAHFVMGWRSRVSTFGQWQPLSS